MYSYNVNNSTTAPGIYMKAVYCFAITFLSITLKNRACTATFDEMIRLIATFNFLLYEIHSDEPHKSLRASRRDGTGNPRLN